MKLKIIAKGQVSLFRRNTRKNTRAADPYFIRIVYRLLGKNRSVILIIVLMKERTNSKSIMFGKIFVVDIVLCVISLRTLPVDLVWFIHYSTY